MERLLATVSDSVEFRDEVMKADREGVTVYARLHGFQAPNYRILPRHADPFQRITVSDLFKMHWPPVYMEDFAQALHTENVAQAMRTGGGEGSPVSVDLFTLEVPGRVR